jgi:hypothetical protein
MSFNFVDMYGTKSPLMKTVDTFSLSLFFMMMNTSESLKMSGQEVSQDKAWLVFFSSPSFSCLLIQRRSFDDVLNFLVGESFSSPVKLRLKS